MENNRGISDITPEQAKDMIIRFMDGYEAIGRLVHDNKMNRRDYQIGYSIITLGQVKHLDKNAFDQAMNLIDFISDGYEEIFSKKTVKL